VQSALSVSIKALEAEVGTALFDRSTHSVELTDAGRALLPEARATLAAAEGARDAVDAVVGGLRGTLRIGIMQSVTAFDLAALLVQFHRARPGVELKPRPARGGTMALVQDVASGELDLAFVSVPGRKHPGVTLMPLVSEPILLAVPPGHRLESRTSVSLEELAGETFVEVPSGWGTRLRTDSALAQAGVERVVGVEVADLSTLAELVRAGFGLGFLPQSTLIGAHRVNLVPLEPNLMWEVSLAIPSARRPAAAALAFVELVHKSLAPAAID
jgi:DNA-binding transcriptional LysR family regulator